METDVIQHLMARRALDIGLPRLAICSRCVAVWEFFATNAHVWDGAFQPTDERFRWILPLIRERNEDDEKATDCGAYATSAPGSV